MNLLVSASALLVACAAFITYDATAFQQGLVRNLSIQSQVAGSNTVAALLFSDPKSADRTLSGFRVAPNIVSACIYDSGGRAFAVYRRDSAAEIPLSPRIVPGENESYWFEQGRVALVHAIVSEGKVIGYAYIQSDLGQLTARFKSYSTISVAVLTAAFITILFVSRLTRRSIAEPVTSLAKTARSVSRDKNYSARTKLDSELTEIAILVEAFNEMLDQIEARDLSLQIARDELERRVQQRTSELAAANKELESFSYSVSHDLRAPLRSIDGFSLALWEDYGEKLDDQAKDFLSRVRQATQRMGVLIDDLLNLARVARVEMRREPIDLSAMAQSIADGLQKSEPNRNVEFFFDEGLEAQGDSHLIKVVLDNLLANAWKYTSKHAKARIEFRKLVSNGHTTYFVKDDGAGFDPKYADRLFGAFQRLHGNTEFPGTGVGLATVQRIINRHGGRIWAKGAVEKGAAFYFTL